MKTTLALYWRNLLRVIHPPLPMTPREKQRMLYLLKKNLRKELNGPAHSTSGRSVDHHVQSVLGSPMFECGSKSVNPRQASRELKKEQADYAPVEYCRWAMAGGYATEETLKRCLTAQIKKSSTAPDFAKSLKDSKAGNLVVQWLWSTGMQRSLQFLSDRRLTQLMIKVLVVDGRHDLILQWIKAREEDPNQMQPLHTSALNQARTLLELLRAESTIGRGSEAAFHIFIQRVEESNRSYLNSETRCTIFGPSTHYLMRLICEETIGGTIKVSLYDELSAVVGQVAERTTFQTAWLAVHHPKRANPEPALCYMQRLSAPYIKKLPPHRRVAIADIAIRAAESFVSKGKQSEALWIMAALKDHFPDVIGLDRDRRPASTEVEKVEARQEWANIRLLERLAMG